MRAIEGYISCDGYLFDPRDRSLTDVHSVPANLLKSSFMRTPDFARLSSSRVSIAGAKSSYNHILALEITDKCNYACRYCFEGRSCENNGFLSLDNASVAIDRLPPGSELRFFGGEPLLNFDLVEQLVAKYPQHSYSLITNGSLITREIARYLAQHNFSVGLSFDGRDFQRRNRISLNGDSLQEFERAMSALKDAGVYTGLCSVITKESIPSLYDIHLEAFADYDADAWAYLLAYEDSLTMSDLNEFKRQIFAIVDRFPVQHLLKINDLVKWAMKVGGEWPLDAYCGAGTCYTALDAQGEERLCTFFLREGGCYTPALRTVEVDCKRCFIWDFCHGGCLALNRFASGDTHRSSPFACGKNLIYFEAGLKTRIKMYEERR